MKKALFLIMFFPLYAQALSTTGVDTTYNILKDLNTYRAKHNLFPIEEDKTLCKLAKIRVEQIKNDWSHDQFQGEIDSLEDMDGVFYENLARSFEAKDVVLGWSMSTMGHNEAMLIPEMKYGCVIQSDDHYVFEGYIPKQ